MCTPRALCDHEWEDGAAEVPGWEASCTYRRCRKCGQGHVYTPCPAHPGHLLSQPIAPTHVLRPSPARLQTR